MAALFFVVLIKLQPLQNVSVGKSLKYINQNRFLSFFSVAFELPEHHLYFLLLL